MKSPNAVEIIPDMWSFGKDHCDWTYQIIGYWDGNLRHPENTSFTKAGAEEFCRKNGLIPCIRPR